MALKDFLRGLFSEDTPHTSEDLGQFVLAVRRDADTSPVNADGDYTPFVQDENGFTKVTSAGGSAGPVTISPSTVTTYYVNFSFAAAGSGNAFEIVWASTVVRILELYITKPSVQITAVLRKQSAASTGGTSVAQTIVPADSGNAAGSGFATVNAYTAVPTAGTLVGNIFSDVMAPTDRIDFRPERNLGQPIVLRAAGESLALNVDGAVSLRGMLVFTAAAS